MIFEIPVRKETDPFNQSVELDGTMYDLGFQFNSRDGAWRMNVSRDGVTLLTGLKLVHSTDLLAQFSYKEDLPPGRLMVQDREGKQKEPDSTNFGDRVILVYEEAA